MRIESQQNVIVTGILFAKTDYDFKEDKYYLSAILTTNGLYEYKTIDTEASNKYEDVEPEYNFVKNNKYDKLKDDIIYNDLRMVLTKDYKAGEVIEYYFNSNEIRYIG